MGDIWLLYLIVTFAVKSTQTMDKKKSLFNVNYYANFYLSIFILWMIHSLK